MDPAHVEWSRRQFAMMKDQGVWGIPRSGLIFQRQGDELVLINRMPHEEGMPVTPEQLTEQQQSIHRYHGSFRGCRHTGTNT